jgi:hypothetical protein
MSLSGTLTEIKFAKIERRYFCPKAARNAIKEAKMRYNRARRFTARQEIEEALFDIKPEDSYSDEDCDWELEMAPYYWEEYNEDPAVAARREAWEIYEENERYLRELEDADEECDWYDTLAEIESAYRGDWQEEVPEVFGDEFEVIVAA